MQKNKLLFSYFVVLSLLNFSCQKSIKPQKTLQGNYSGFITSEYIVESSNGDMIKGSAEIKFFDFVIEKYNKDITYHFLPQEIKQLLNKTNYIFKSNAEFKGEIFHYDREKTLINSFSLVNTKEVIEITGGFLDEESKMWIISDTNVKVLTKEKVTFELPSLELGFYLPGNIPSTYHAFLIRYNFLNDKIVINDIKVSTGGFGKANIRISGEFVKK